MACGRGMVVRIYSNVGVGKVVRELFHLLWLGADSFADVGW